MKLLFITALLFSSVAYAQVLPPICQNGHVAYFTPDSQYADFCVHGLDAAGPADCEKQMLEFEKDKPKFIAMYKKFIARRDKEVCGK